MKKVIKVEYLNGSISTTTYSISSKLDELKLQINVNSLLKSTNVKSFSVSIEFINANGGN